MSCNWFFLLENSVDPHHIQCFPYMDLTAVDRHCSFIYFFNEERGEVESGLSPVSVELMLYHLALWTVQSHTFLERFKVTYSHL